MKACVELIQQVGAHQFPAALARGRVAEAELGNVVLEAGLGAGSSATLRLKTRRTRVAALLPLFVLKVARRAVLARLLAALGLELAGRAIVTTDRRVFVLEVPGRAVVALVVPGRDELAGGTILALAL
jgi:hypothetical protein